MVPSMLRVMNTTLTDPNTGEIVLPRPDQIKEYLDRFVIGQDEAKKTLAGKGQTRRIGF